MAAVQNQRLLLLEEERAAGFVRADTWFCSTGTVPWNQTDWVGVPLSAALFMQSWPDFVTFSVSLSMTQDY